MYVIRTYNHKVNTRVYFSQLYILDIHILKMTSKIRGLVQKKNTQDTEFYGRTKH